MIKRTLTLRGYMKNTPDRNIALDYDDADAYLILKSIFNKSNFAFLTTDTTLLDTDVSERTLCGALKSHLEKELSIAKIEGYYVDVEYNRNGGQVKTILHENLEVVSIQCDLIVHSRGTNIKQDNLIAIEMKKSYRDQSSKDQDRMRLRALTKSTYDNDIWAYDGKSFPECVCRYILGIFYEIDRDNRKIYLEFYRNGKLISKSKIFYKSSFLSKEINCCSSNPEDN